jgi:hypothetical protein
MNTDQIKRDRDALANTRFCQERNDGSLVIFLQGTGTSLDGTMIAELSSEQIAPGVAFAETWIHLTGKNWFTPKIAADFVNVVTARWLAVARGWVLPHVVERR